MTQALELCNGDVSMKCIYKCTHMINGRDYYSVDAGTIREPSEFRKFLKESQDRYGIKLYLDNENYVIAIDEESMRILRDVLEDKIKRF